MLIKKDVTEAEIPMTNFIKTMNLAINQYRTLLRKSLSQHERMKQLDCLDLHRRKNYTDEVMLYKIGYNIVGHLHELSCTRKSKKQYHRYSGYMKLAEYLECYLEKYTIDDGGDCVLNTRQFVARHVVSVIQILSPKIKTRKNIFSLIDSHRTIMQYGSKKQIQYYQRMIRDMAYKYQYGRYDELYSSTFKQVIVCLENRIIKPVLSANEARINSSQRRASA
jgi:hypothetical protein